MNVLCIDSVRHGRDFLLVVGDYSSAKSDSLYILVRRYSRLPSVTATTVKCCKPSPWSALSTTLLTSAFGRYEKDRKKPLVQKECFFEEKRLITNGLQLIGSGSASTFGSLLNNYRKSCLARQRNRRRAAPSTGSARSHVFVPFHFPKVTRSLAATWLLSAVGLCSTYR